MALVSTSYKPGQSGNLNGRPKKEWTMKGLIEEALEEASETGEEKKKLVAKKLVDLALAGEIVAIKEVNNRIDGMPQQDVTSAGEPIKSIDISSLLTKVYGPPNPDSIDEVSDNS